MNTATVSRAEAEFDISDNTVSSTISATPLADLELKRTDLLGSNSNNHEHEDDQIISEFRITNNGPSDATNVVLTNELTVNVVLVSVSVSQVSCTVIGGTVVCDLGDLANGESVTFTIVLAPVTGGQISSKVGATSDQSVTSTLDPWEFFLDLSGPDSDLTPASALLESVVGSSNNLLVASGLLGLALTALALILGNNVFTGNGRRTETEA